MAEQRSTHVASQPHAYYDYQVSGPEAPERVLAASAHLAILLSVFGMVYAAVLWLTLRRSAPFVSRHALQGLLWQISTTIVLVLALVALFVLALFSFGTTLNAVNSDGGKGLIGIFGSLLGVFVVLIVGLTVAVGAAVIGAVYALAGREFRYPFFNQRRQ